MLHWFVSSCTVFVSFLGPDFRFLSPADHFHFSSPVNRLFTPVAPAFVARPSTPLREGGERGGQRGGGRRGGWREDTPGGGEDVGEIIVPRRGWNGRAGTSGDTAGEEPDR